MRVERILISDDTVFFERQQSLISELAKDKSFWTLLLYCMTNLNDFVMKLFTLYVNTE